MGVFYQPDNLRKAIDLLKDHTSLQGGLVVLGTEKVITELFPNKPFAQAGQSGACAVEPIKSQGDSEGLSQYAESFESWLAPTAAANLKRHIGHRACILFMPYSSAPEELAIFRILIDLASDRVELHDLPNA